MGAAAVVAATCLAPAVARAAPELDLVVEGRRSAVTEIVLTEPLQARGLDAEVTGGNAYAGALIEPLDQQQSVGHYLVLRFKDMPTAVVPANAGRFQPGRYRVRLFADAPARVTVHLDQGSAPGRVVRPTRPLTVTTRSGQQPLAAGRSDAELRLGGAVPARHGAVLLMTAFGRRLEQTYACATAGSSCPSLPARPPAPFSDVDPGVRPPSTSEGYADSYVRSSDQRRDALFGVDGVRSEGGAIRAGVLTYLP